MFSHLRYGEKSAAAIRRQSLETNSRYWKLLRSSVDCFICLQRKPEHLTSCCHGICDSCVSLAVFSRPTKGRESYYDIRVCPQCQAEIRFQARLLPKTCRVRFVAFDGGGSRGIVSLAYMEELRQALGLRYPVQENFDYAIGTSSGQWPPAAGRLWLILTGGVAAIGLFGKYWSPKECIAFFRKFARNIFPSKEGFRSSICTMMRRTFLFYLEDGKYDAARLEENLRVALGPGAIFDPVEARTSGMKFAVTATTISDATLCLISNYNGQGDHSKELSG